MGKKLSSSELNALAIATLMREARVSLDFYKPVEKITGKSYDNSPAQAIMINLALRSLPKKVDQYIVLAMWASLPQYAGIEKVMERRNKLKEDIHFPKTTKTLSDKEDRNFAKIAKKCVSYSPERLKSIVDEGLAKYYDAENDRVILPELVLPGSETGDAAATRDHAADKGKADDKQVKEEMPTDSAAVPDNAPASEEADGPHDPVADNTEPENDSAALESAPEISGTEDREEKNTGSEAVPGNAPANEEADGAHDPVADDAEPENDSAVVDSAPEDFGTEEDDIGTPSKIKRKIKLQIIAILIILVVMVFIPAIYLLVSEPHDYDDALNIDYTVDLHVRNQGTKIWYDGLDKGQVGDIVELQFEFLDKRSAGGSLEARTSKKLGLIPGPDDVIMAFYLTENLKYIANTATLYNSDYPDGLQIDDSIVTPYGVNLGSYYLLGNSYVQISCVIVNNSLQSGENYINPSAHASISGEYDENNIMYDEDSCMICVTY